ncbi:hypothetical protein GCM10017774_13750 [Lentzea cavernae]|uniref:Uncharacterized protein n=1 Tax=Lentzea cavernae TaxID=2020703 RepID=A0ABQ3M3F2_9PSEU|nr:hypothetical protein GCM10017774_13750 [Lentzea cavernae]
MAFAVLVSWKTPREGAAGCALERHGGHRMIPLAGAQVVGRCHGVNLLGMLSNALHDNGIVVARRDGEGATTVRAESAGLSR